MRLMRVPGFAILPGPFPLLALSYPLSLVEKAPPFSFLLMEETVILLFPPPPVTPFLAFLLLLTGVVPFFRLRSLSS